MTLTCCEFRLFNSLQEFFMSILRFFLKLSLEAARNLQFSTLSALVTLGAGGLFLAIRSSSLLYSIVIIGYFYLRFPLAVSQLITLLAPAWLWRLGNGYTTTGVVTGTLLFAAITTSANPVQAQIFDDAEQEVDSIFGEYLDSGIITFLFGLIRVVIWVSAVGFVFFAIYQAQRGEQWQPLAQNAFIIVAAVVLVEGLSALFFGGEGGGDDGGDDGGGGDDT
jgi:hypothetical protein